MQVTFTLLLIILLGGGGADGVNRDATLCGDRACQVRGMQAKLRFLRSGGNRGMQRNCVSCGRAAFLCGDRARRVRGMQVKLRFLRSPRDPLRTSCVWSARNAGKVAFSTVLARPSADIARVERAECR